jgi:tetratricopeptide (TPR) repeat protein
MKRTGYIIFSISVFLLLINSCSKKLEPSLVVGKSGKSYDAAAFNYVYVEALKQKLMGNNADALKYLEKCIEINPECDAAYYQMAQIVLSTGDIKNGKLYASKAISIENKNIWYIMMMASIYYQEKNIDSAIIYYEKAVNLFPEKNNLELTLGNLYSENGNFEKANSIYNSIENKVGVNETVTISALKNLLIAEKYDEALIKANALLEQKPDEVLYNGLLAEVYRGQGKNEKASDVYKRLLDRNPDNPQIQLAICDFLLSEKNYNELFVMLNMVWLNNNINTQDKIALFARMIELPELIEKKADDLIISLMVLEANYKSDPVIPLLRPDILIKQQKFYEAAERLEEIVIANKDNYYAWEKLLFVYLQMKDYDKLMKKGEECATLFNRSFTAKILYANGAIEKGEYSIAIEELRKAEILAGDNKDYLIQVYTMRADTYYRMKEYDKAFGIFEEAIKIDSGDLTILNNYAYYLAEQNMKLKEAEIMAKKVIDTEKNNTTFLDTYGWVLYKRGKLKEAAKIMEHIINSGKEPDAEWYEHYGYILKKQKKCEKAIENWEMAKKLDNTKIHLNKEIENCRK